MAAENGFKQVETYLVRVVSGGYMSCSGRSIVKSVMQKVNCIIESVIYIVLDGVYKCTLF